MKKINLILTTTLFATLVSCVNGDDYGTPDLASECISENPTKEVAEIKAAAVTNTPALYQADDVIEAYVTSSDEGGNFYKTISLVSTDDINDGLNSVGFTIPINAYNIYTKFEPGRKVYVHLKDLYYTFDSQTSSLQIGELYNTDEIGRISAVKYENVILRGCDKVDEEDLVKHITMSDLNDSYLHKLVEFDNVQFANASIGHTYHDEALSYVNATATNHSLVSNEGGSITVRCSAYSTFASDQIPSGSGKVRGVLTKYGSAYQLMIRTLNDVKLDEGRVYPLLDETFETTTFPNWIAYNVAGTQVWGLSSLGSSTNVPYANINGGTTVANEDWLISPALDLSSITNAILSFETAGRYLGPVLEIKVSSNYDGTSNPNTATWVDYTSQAHFPTITSSAFSAFESSGALNISADFAGQTNVRIAFKYTSLGVGSGTSTNWEVDNVKVVGQ